MTPQQAHQQAATIGDDALSRQHRKTLAAA